MNSASSGKSVFVALWLTLSLAASMPGHAATDITLNTLPDDQGVTLFTSGFDGAQGVGLAPLGDLNGDGFDDVIVGALFGSTNSGYNDLVATVYFGSATADAMATTLGELDGTNGLLVTLASNSPNEISQITTGDFDGDGLDDAALLLLGDIDSTDNTRESTVYIVYGSAFLGTNGVLALDQLGSGEVTVIDDAHHFALTGSYEAINVNGDAFDDLVLGSIRETLPNGTNVVAKVIYGGPSLVQWVDGTALNGSNGFTIVDTRSDGLSLLVGASTFPLGDVDNDGLGDFTVKVHYNNVSVRQELILGASIFPAIVDLANLANVPSLTINNFETTVTGYAGPVGDINGDGANDMYFHVRDSGSTRAIIVFGPVDVSAPSLTLDSTLVDAGRAVFLAALDRPRLTQIGDVNGDGVDDIGVSALPNSGVVLGRPKLPSNIQLSDYDVALKLSPFAGSLGLYTASAGDINGDSLNDWLISAPFVPILGGVTYLLYGSTDFTLPIIDPDPPVDGGGKDKKDANNNAASAPSIVNVSSYTKTAPAITDRIQNVSRARVRQLLTDIYRCRTRRQAKREDGYDDNYQQTCVEWASKRVKDRDLGWAKRHYRAFRQQLTE